MRSDTIKSLEPTGPRRCEVFLQQRGALLGQHGYAADNTPVERTSRGIVFYHYTWSKRLAQITDEGSGLLAYQTIAARYSPFASDLEGCRQVSGFLEPLPRWLTQCPYFGDFGMRHLQKCIGTLLLRIQVPPDFPGLYVRDYAFQMEELCFRQNGREPLGLGFNHKTWKDESHATLNSFVPLNDYRGGHVAPVLTVTREGEGIVIPRESISVCDVQPLSRQ
jgi:hypothetical protein